MPGRPDVVRVAVTSQLVGQRGRARVAVGRRRDGDGDGPPPIGARARAPEPGDDGAHETQHQARMGGGERGEGVDVEADRASCRAAR